MRGRTKKPTLHQDAFKRTFKGIHYLTLGEFVIDDIIDYLSTTLKSDYAKEIRIKDQSIFLKSHSHPVVEWNNTDLWIDGARGGSQTVARIISDFMGLESPFAECASSPKIEAQEWLYKGPTYASSSNSGKTMANGEFILSQGNDCVMHNWMSLEVLSDWVQRVLGCSLVRVDEGLFKCTVKGRSGNLCLHMTTARGVIQITGNVEERRERLVLPLNALFRSWDIQEEQEVFHSPPPDAQIVDVTSVQSRCSRIVLL